jgi:glutamyl-tRNA synthetase
LERAKTKRPALRVRVPAEEISFVDGNLGEYRENLARDCGDFILRRSDGVFAYQLAVVVDDGWMGVNQVVRGSDLLDSTPRQIWLQRQLGLPTPNYFHLPLLLAPDGRRLSKRERDLDFGALRAELTSEELVGLLAYLAGIIDHRESVSARELVSEFSWDKVRKTDIVWDGTL